MSTVSIIIPAFNREKILPATLQSILNQSFSDFECIVIDDHSTDATAGVIEEFAKRDRRITYVLNSRKKGAQGARNTGLLIAKGSCILFFDSDNILHRDFLLRTAEVLDRSPGVDICTTYSNVVDENHQVTGAFTWDCNGKILKGLLEGSAYVDFNAALIRKSILDKAGLLDEMCISYQEYDTFIRLAACGAEFRTVPEKLVDYYRRNAGTISSDAKRDFEGFFYIMKKHRALWLETAGSRIYKKRLRELSNRAWKINFPEVRKIWEEIPEFRAVNRRQNFLKPLYKLRWLLSK